MSRLFTRRVLGIHALAVLAVVACLALAHWQWNRAHVAQGSQSVAKSGSINELDPLRQYLPVSSIGASVSLDGTWLPHSQIVLKDRFANGPSLLSPAPTPTPTDGVLDVAEPSCAWISNGLELADGSVIQVVRGCSTSGEPIAEPAGASHVTGVLQPSEDSNAARMVSVTDSLTTSKVVAATGKTTHDGFVVAVPALDGLTQVTPMLVSSPHIPLHWRNVFYVFNWLFFAVIVIAMWIRVLFDELRDDESEQK